MKKSSKRGFTIVELVIILAVIAILASVIVAVAVGTVKRANEAAAISAVTELNKALISESHMGNTPQTVHDAVKLIEGYGIGKKKLSEVNSGYCIFYDSQHQLFCYGKRGERIKYTDGNAPADGKKTEDYMIWEFRDSIPMAEDQIYSIYWTGESSPGGNVNLRSIGFDTGDCSTDGTALVFDERTEAADAPRNIIVRTDGGRIIFRAKGDAVDHYGRVGNLSIIAGAYTEHGFVSNILAFTGGKFTSTAETEFHDTEEYLKANIFTKECVFSLGNGEKYGIHRLGEDERCLVCWHKEGELLFHEGFADAKDGATITLIDDIEALSKLVVDKGKSITIDLNGHTLTIKETVVIYGDLTIRDSSEEQTGMITMVERPNANSLPVVISLVNGKFTLESGKIMNNAIPDDSFTDYGNDIAIDAIGRSETVISGGMIYGSSVGVHMHDCKKGNSFTITGGSISADEYALFIESNANIVNINAAEGKSVSIYGKSAGILSDNASSINISGNTEIKSDNTAIHFIGATTSNISITDARISGYTGIRLEKMAGTLKIIGNTEIKADRHGIYMYNANATEVSVSDNALISAYSSIYSASGSPTINITDNAKLEATHFAIYAGISKNIKISISGDPVISASGISKFQPVFPEGKCAIRLEDCQGELNISGGTVSVAPPDDTGIPTYGIRATHSHKVYEGMNINVSGNAMINAEEDNAASYGIMCEMVPSNIMISDNAKIYGEQLGISVTYPGIAFSNSISFAVSGNCVIEGGIRLDLIAPERLLKTDISLTGGSIGKAEILTSDKNNSTMLIGKDLKSEVITCNTTMQITYGDGCEYTESVAEGTVTIVPGSDS